MKRTKERPFSDSSSLECRKKSPRFSLAGRADEKNVPSPYVVRKDASDNGIETIFMDHGNAGCTPTVISVNTSDSNYPYKVHWSDGIRSYEQERVAFGLLADYFRKMASSNRRLYESKVYDSDSRGRVLKAFVEENKKLQAKIDTLEKEGRKIYII